MGTVGGENVLTVGGKAVDAMLLDKTTARDLLSLLPMTLTLEDYASAEKIGYPSRKLSTAGAPAGGLKVTIEQVGK